MQNSLYKLFEHKCVLEACVHIHPIMIKIHPVLFKKIPFSNQAAPTIVDWQGQLTLDPPWVNRHQSAIVSTPVQGKTRCLRLSDWGVLLLDVIMNSRLDENRADFDRVKKVFLHYHWEFFTQVCYRLFIETLKNHINLWKMGIRWPL